MKNTIDIEVRREQTSIEKLIYDIGISNMLDHKTTIELCRKIRTAAMIDAENIRRDASFAVNKLSEALERMTRQLEDKPTVTFNPPETSIDGIAKIMPLAERQEGGVK